MPAGAYQFARSHPAAVPNTALCSLASVERCFAYWARRFELSMRPMHRVQQSEAFGDPIVKIAAIGFEWMKAGDVELGQIHGRFPFHDPLGQSPADARRAEDALRIEPRRDVEPTNFGRLADYKFIVRGKAFGAVSGNAGCRSSSKGVSSQLPSSSAIQNNFSPPGVRRTRTARAAFPWATASREARTSRPRAYRRLPSRKQNRRRRAGPANHGEWTDAAR